MSSSTEAETLITASPIIPWIGGKRRLAPILLPLFPDHTCYVEPFAGAAALFFLKQPSDVEVLNDINGELVNLYRVVKHHLEEFVRAFKWGLSSRQVFEWEQMTRPETLTDIHRAARFYYLQKHAFGGRVDSQTFGVATTSPPRLNLVRIEEELSQAWLRLQGTYIEHGPWHDVVRRYDRSHSLFYCDPPYWETEGYGCDFPAEEYLRMADLAKTIQGTMIISVNDHPFMREVFSGLEMRSIPIRYTVGGGEGVERRELIIGTWRGGWPRPKAEQLGLLMDGAE